jgi:hypothetical protein
VCTPTRFDVTVRLDPLRVSRDADQVAREVLQRLTSLVGAEVEAILEISAHILEGAPVHVVRTVTENCRTLRFQAFEFEES